MILYAGYLFYPLYQAMNISNKMIDSTIPFQQHPMSPTKNFLVAGDSIAVGIGAEDPKESIAGRLGHQFPNADITNLGMSGAKLEDLLLILQQQNKHYDLILLLIGGNDITHFTPYNIIRDELAEVISRSLELSPKIIILTAGNIGNAPAFHWPLSTLITDRTSHVREIFMDEISKNKSVTYMDLFKKNAEDPLLQNVRQYYSKDGFHLSGDGYGIWYLSIQKQLMHD